MQIKYIQGNVQLKRNFGQQIGTSAMLSSNQI